MSQGPGKTTLKENTKAGAWSFQSSNQKSTNVMTVTTVRPQQ